MHQHTRYSTLSSYVYVLFNVRACAYQTAIDAANGQNMHIQLMDKDATEDESLGR